MFAQCPGPFSVYVICYSMRDTERSESPAMCSWSTEECFCQATTRMQVQNYITRAALTWSFTSYAADKTTTFAILKQRDA